jgi:LCP family protein required for cell wall assembly
LKKKKTVFIIVGAVVLVAVVASIVAYPKIIQKWEQPLGPQLGLGTEEPASIPTQTGEPSNPEAGSDQGTNTETPPTSTPTPEPLCGGPAEMTILAVGIDYRNDNYLYGLADVIRIVHVDFTIPRVAVLTIPRDLWVEVPGISDHYGITHSKLNQSYFYGVPANGYYDGSGGGAGLLAETLALNFGLRVDHYGVINMLTFEDLIDAVGGVEVYLENAVDGRIGEENLGYFPAGWNTLNGEKALKLARIRKVDTVFDRADRQTLIICAFKDKLLSPSAVKGIPQMISAFTGRVLTDLSPADISELACLAPKLTRENLVFASFPQDIFEPSTVYDPEYKRDTFIFDVDFDVLANYIDQFLAGTWPDKDSGGGMSCPVYVRDE